MMGIFQWLGLLPETTPLRSKEDQARVDQQCRALQLYQFSGCPFCFRVKRAIRLLQLNIETHDTINDNDKAHELVIYGGKSQVPCLRIEEKGKVIWLYESADIVDYLQSQFAIEE